jgi:hypothetical protein
MGEFFDQEANQFMSSFWRAINVNEQEFVTCSVLASKTFVLYWFPCFFFVVVVLF